MGEEAVEPRADNEGPRGFDAVGMLTVYLVLLFAIPSNVTLTGLGAYGRPSLLWGLLLLGWWSVWRLQGNVASGGWIRQPTRIAMTAFVIVALASFAQAMLRGQPADQVSPAMSAMVRLASWTGVFLVGLDGIGRTADAARLLRRLVLSSALLSTLGLLQFITRRSLLDWVGFIPGLTYEAEEGVALRGLFARATGTATHPLEFGAVVVGTLPLCIAAAMSNGFRNSEKRFVRWWLPVAATVAVCLVSVSRSAIIGLAVAMLSSIPNMTRSARYVLVVGAVVSVGVVSVAVPGMFSTVVSLFVGATDDPSTQSRADALSRVPEFLSASPVLGAGLGTFLPRYYIFDNQWVLTLVDLGVAGTMALAAIFITSGWSALKASRSSADHCTVKMGRSLVASVFTLAVLYMFFDAFAFPMSVGVLFLLSGLCGALHRVTAKRVVARHALRGTE